MSLLSILVLAVPLALGIDSWPGYFGWSLLTFGR